MNTDRPDATADEPRRPALVRLARRSTAPVRNYLNGHFEAVKDEVRRLGTSGVSSESDSASDVVWQRVAELEAQLAGQELSQAHLLSRLGEEVSEMSARIAAVEQQLLVLIEMVTPPEPDPAAPEPDS